MDRKREQLESGAETHPFIDPAGYRKFIERGRTRFEKRLKAERELQKASP